MRSWRRYYGPFEILKKIGKVAYRLQLPPTARIHNVFHVSQLKRALKPTIPAQPLPQGLTEDMELVVEPEHIHAVRRGRGGQLQLLIKWKGLPEHDNTWEDAIDIQIQFPHFHLEDKVILEAVGDDGLDHFWGQVYRRRNKLERKGGPIEIESPIQNMPRGDHGEKQNLTIAG